MIIRQAGAGVSVQDLGREGYLAFGVSRGGAADRLALYEGAALLGQDPGCAAVEMAGFGGVFEMTHDTRIALTGAPMRASVDGKPLVWNASHMVLSGQVLEIGGVRRGSYGYLHIGGGLATPKCLGARSTHLAGGLGAKVKQGDRLPLGGDQTGDAASGILPQLERFEGGVLRVVSSAQTELFGPAEIARFEATEFRRDARGNRMGVRLTAEGEGFYSDAGLSVLSQSIVPGDIQIAGDGLPFVLLSECQTTGGYPRIGTVLPCDLPWIAQAPPNASLRFVFVGLEQAVEIERAAKAQRHALPNLVQPLVRNPYEIADLLSYQLISGVTAGDDLEREMR